MKRNISFSFVLLFSICFSTIQAESEKEIDSLKAVLKKAKPDTNKAKILYQLSEIYWHSDPELSKDYAKEMLALSQEIGFRKGVGNAYGSLATVNSIQGNYQEALDLQKKALSIRIAVGYKKGIASSYNSIGNIYSNMGNYPFALNGYFAALKIREEMGDKYGIAAAYNNIGIIYETQENFVDALKNYKASLKLRKEIGDEGGIATSLSNMGNTYQAMGNSNEALKSHLTALKLQEKIDDKFGIASTLSNIGNAYYYLGNYKEALAKYLTALKIREEIDDKEGIANSYNNLGNVYSLQKQYAKAKESLDKGLAIAKEIGSLDYTMILYESLAVLDSSQGNTEGALRNYKLFITYRDSLFNEDNTRKTVQQQMQYDFDKKESLTKAEQEKKDAIADEELQKQKLVRNGFVGGFAVVVLFAGIFFTQRNKIKKGKQLSDELLLNILPAEVAEELKEKGNAEAKLFDDVTVMFTDFKGFTQISEKLTPTELVAEIHTCFKAFDHIIDKHNIEKIKTIGDSYMCAGGLPVSNKTNAVDVVNAAIEIREFMKEHLLKRVAERKEPFELRIGIHSGPVVAGIVGIKKFAYDIWGDTVNTASRMESSGEAGQINISGNTYDIVKDKFNCIYRGKIMAKNKGEIDMYFVEGSL